GLVFHICKIPTNSQIISLNSKVIVVNTIDAHGGVGLFILILQCGPGGCPGEGCDERTGGSISLFEINRLWKINGRGLLYLPAFACTLNIAVSRAQYK